MFDARIVSKILENDDTLAENVNAIFYYIFIWIRLYYFMIVRCTDCTLVLQIGNISNEQFVIFWIVRNGKYKCIRHFNNHFNFKNKLRQQTENPTVFISQWPAHVQYIRKLLGDFFFFFCSVKWIPCINVYLDRNALLVLHKPFNYMCVCVQRSGIPHFTQHW